MCSCAYHVSSCFVTVSFMPIYDPIVMYGLRQELYWLSWSKVIISVQFLRYGDIRRDRATPTCTNFRRGSEPGWDGSGRPLIIWASLMPTKYVLGDVIPAFSKHTFLPLNRGVVETFSCVPMISLHQRSLSGPKPRDNPSAYT